jgi:hypothetical protein
MAALLMTRATALMPMAATAEHDRQRMSKPLRKGAVDAAQSIGLTIVFD